jgi:TPR repeat protein
VRYLNWIHGQMAYAYLVRRTYVRPGLAVRHRTGDGVERDDVKAVALFRESAAQGHLSPQRELGNCYFAGEGVEQNFSTAAEWYRAAGDQGREARALMSLGTLYFEGKLGGDRGELPGWDRLMMLATS